MKFRPRSFPHPVLGNGDDVDRYEFQANCSFHSDRQYYYFRTEYQTSNPTLRELLNIGAAAYVLHIECSSTFYRRRFILSQAAETLRIPADALRGNVEVNFFVCANADLPGYQIAGCHADYEDTRFDVKRGDVLAVAEGVTFPAEKDYDAIRKVSSIMQVEKSDTDERGLMRVRPTDNKIRVILPAEDYNLYAQMKGDARWATILSGTVVLPALMEAIGLAETDDSDYQDQRWCQLLKQQLEKLPPALETPLLKAQQLYEMPVYRVCSNLANVVKGD